MRTRLVKWTHQFTHPAETLWPVITNTDRMNRFMGLAPVAYKSEAKAGGGATLVAHNRVLGLELIWTENPYEWVKNQYFSVERNYRSGPLRNMWISWELKPRPDGCTLEQTIRYEPSSAASSLIAAFEIHGNVRRSFARFYQHVETSLSTLRSLPAPALSRAVFSASAGPKFRPTEKVVQRIREALKQTAVSETLQKSFTELLLTWQDADLVRLRPFAVAESWEMDREQVLSGFLRATQAGLFDLSWDIICPSCRGAKVQSSTLSALKKEAHCEQCNISYDAQFDRSVELSFTPNAAIRKVESVEFCAGSPQNTQHFLLQQRIAPGQRTQFSVDLGPGHYRFRSLQSKKRYSLEVERSAAPAQHMVLEFGPSDAEPLKTMVGQGLLKITAVNQNPHELVLTLEQGDQFENACTAAFVTSFQDFRDLFASEVLHVGERLSLSSITLLFTDLKDSTALYTKIGDAKAFAVINEHLKMLTDCVRTHHGAVIKTIGDAVMASFIRPEDALSAALEIQAKIAKSEIVPVLGELLTVKIGIHAGPCFVVNLNDRLDYFGTTVNLAARAQSECEGGGILVTGRVTEDPGVHEALRHSGIAVEKILRRIKGMEGEIELFRIIASPNHSAQTA